MRSSPVFLGMVLLLACGEEVAPAPPAPLVVSPPAVAAPSAPGPIELGDASIVEVARALATSTGASVIVDPRAQEIAHCARVAVIAPEPRDEAQLMDLVGEALRTSGLRLERTENGAVIRRDQEAAPPPSCTLAVAAAERAPAAAADERPQAAEQGAQPAAPASTDGIRRRGAEALITRARVDALLADQTQLMRQARIVPHQVDGEIVGVKLYGLRSEGVLSRLGFRSGDLVTAVNGTEIGSPERALELYAGLRGADSVTVAIERGGAPTELRIRVVERLP